MDAWLSDETRSGLWTKKWPRAIPRAAPFSTLNNAQKMGNWISSGTQLAVGLTPSSLYIFMVSWPSRSRSAPYFSCSSFSFGCSACMARDEFSCLAYSGIIKSRMNTVRTTMDSVHVTPESVPNSGSKSECASTMMPDTAQ